MRPPEPNGTPVPAELEQLESSMRELLSCLGDARWDEGHLRAAWSRCERHGASIARYAAEARHRGEAQRRALVSAFERLVQLNAIVREALGAERRRMAAALGRARRSGRELRYYAANGPGGRSCDVSG